MIGWLLLRYDPPGSWDKTGALLSKDTDFLFVLLLPDETWGRTVDALETLRESSVLRRAFGAGRGAAGVGGDTTGMDVDITGAVVRERVLLRGEAGAPSMKGDKIFDGRV